jgi:hypothetical protein
VHACILAPIHTSDSHPHSSTNTYPHASHTQIDQWHPAACPQAISADVRGETWGVPGSGLGGVSSESQLTGWVMAPSGNITWMGA